MSTNDNQAPANGTPAVINQPGATEPTASETAALTPYQEATGMVRAYAAKLVGDDRAKQFATTLSILARQNPNFMKAKPESVVSAMMACVQLDLIPNTPEQHAFLIPYGDNVQFQLGYKGLVTLAHRSGHVKSISAELVFDGDYFKWELGLKRKLVHRPDLDIDRTDYSKVTHAYCVAALDNGETVFEVMSRKELDKVKDSAKAKSTDSPWNTWPEAMAKKTVVKRITKLIPSSRNDNRVQLAAQFDSWAEAGRLALAGDQIVQAEAVSGESPEDRKKRIKAEMEKEAVDLDGGFEPQIVK